MWAWHCLLPVFQVQHLTCFSVELHVHTRTSLKPDPEVDPILAVFYFIHHDWPHPHGGGARANSRLGVVAIDLDSTNIATISGRGPNKATPNKGDVATPIKASQASFKLSHELSDCHVAFVQTAPSAGAGYLSGCGLSSEVEVTHVTSELALLQALVRLVAEEDPDILIGYEVVMSSWGYLIDRAAVLNVNLIGEISRICSKSVIYHMIIM